jgi:D-glycero-alpha-D-manno-heptose-7-phosphate kinase
MTPEKREVIARAPTRIDLGGGWTDVPPYCDREGGFVCNVAITRFATARVRAGHRDAAGSRAAPGDAPLVDAALRRAGLTGVDVTLENDYPVGAGLGGSSAASAAVLGALAVWRGVRVDRVETAEEGRRIEVEELGVAGGRQDHYAATHGGALALTFTDRVVPRRIPLSARMKRGMRERTMLIYTGQSRISGDTITAVLGAYEVGEPRVVNALRCMRELAKAMAVALERSDLDAIGELMNEHWAHQRSLHPSIPTPRIDEIVARGRAAGALGAKAMGASGGGCVFVVSREASVDAVRTAVSPLFDIDEHGLTIVRGLE